VTATNVNGDGKADNVIGSGAGGGPQVVLCDGSDQSMLANFASPAQTGRHAIFTVRAHSLLIGSTELHHGPQRQEIHEADKQFPSSIRFHLGSHPIFGGYRQDS
jgi:hypothetical protein